jgi:hypothetical protein
VNDGDWQDPDFMRAGEGRGTPIRVREGTAERVRVTAIAP